MHIPYTAKHLRGKTFAVGVENDRSQEMFAVAASFNNECLWLVNYSLVKLLRLGKEP